VRLLFTVRSGLGHLHPMMPTAMAARARGHEVAFAGGESLRGAVERSGFTFFGVGLDLATEAAAERLAPELVGLVGKERAAMYWRKIFAGREPIRAVPELVELASSWSPDVVVRDDTNFAGCIAAERLGLVHAAVHTVAYRPLLYELVAGQLSERRAEVGLLPDPDLSMPFRYLYLSSFPPGFLDPAVAMPATTHYLRPNPFDDSGEEELPAWAAELGDAPLVFVSLGTIVNQRSAVFDTLIRALRDLPVKLIVTVGRDQDPHQFGPQPGNVHIERYLPQTQLFPMCSVVVTHGGSGTITGALTAGLPMVIVPIAADQPENAERCAALGVARVVPLQELSEKRARDAVVSVLGDETCRLAAQHLARLANELPGLDHAVDLLERLVTERQPIDPVTPGSTASNACGRASAAGRTELSDNHMV
jgi:UDP:flavonoid glycosyltransferase YjiC (YdhE family)